MRALSSLNIDKSLDREQIVTVEDLQDCLAAPAKILKTQSGQFEYSIRGEGPPLLISHGGPGGYDQALIIGELFRKNGFQIIAPSRPGYLGTPLNGWTTAEKQGDFMAAFLDGLGIQKTGVISVSGGGPAAYQLSQRHPDRVSRQIIIDGIAMNYTKGDDINPIEEWMYLSKPGQWLTGFLFNHFPAQVVKSFLQTESSLDRHEIGQRVKEIISDKNKFAMMDAMIKTMCGRFKERKSGAENDIALGKAIDRLPLDAVSCPTLIIHAREDNDVPPRDAEYAHQAISGSQLLWIEKASHIGFWTADDAYKIQKFALDWLRSI